MTISFEFSLYLHTYLGMTQMLKILCVNSVVCLGGGKGGCQPKPNFEVGSNACLAYQQTNIGSTKIENKFVCLVECLVTINLL